MAQFWLEQFIRVEYDVMHYCSIAQKGQREDSDHNLGPDYGYDCDLHHLQDIDTSNGHDRDEC